VARVVGGERWRTVMPLVRQVAVERSDAGELVVLQRGAPVSLPVGEGPRSTGPSGLRLASLSMQEEVWNDLVGSGWAEHVEELDRVHEPFTAALLERLGDVAGQRVLEVGCGCGSLSLALAERGADTTGVDLSRAMVEVAQTRSRGTAAHFELGDAATWTPADGGSFDVVVSQFGWMFFPEPVDAFRHLRSLTTAGGRFVGATWGDIGGNPWMTTPVLASAEALGPPALPGPTDPGPFGFADPERTRSVLEEAGWSVGAIDQVRAEVTWGHGAEAAADAAMAYNPVLAAGIARNPERADDARALIVDAFRRLERDGTVWVDAAAWLVEAVRR
jgi:SAM-dependent methyltransferase